VDPVRVAPGAVLAPLHALGVLPLVLIRKEVAVLALGAFENDLVSRHLVARLGLEKARDRDRTGDLILTKDALYRLSYASAIASLLLPRVLHKRATGLEPATLSLEG
jgi:hypothetical protein